MYLTSLSLQRAQVVFSQVAINAHSETGTYPVRNHVVSALRESDLRGLRINGLRKRGRTGLFTHLDLPSSLAAHFSSVCAFVEGPVAEAALFGNSEKRAGNVDAKL